jgi:hypothetical protein
MERARAVQAEQQAMADIERQLGIKRAREAQTTVDGLMSIKDEHQKPEESGSIDNYSAAAWK